MDHYSRLRVRREASQDQIRRAYRRMSRKLHPDVNPDPIAQETYKEVTQAYEVLSDPDDRREYGNGPAWYRPRPMVLDLRTELFNPHLLKDLKVLAEQQWVEDPFAVTDWLASSLSGTTPDNDPRQRAIFASAAFLHYKDGSLYASDNPRLAECVNRPTGAAEIADIAANAIRAFDLELATRHAQAGDLAASEFLNDRSLFLVTRGFHYAIHRLRESRLLDTDSTTPTSGRVDLLTSHLRITNDPILIDLVAPTTATTPELQTIARAILTIAQPSHGNQAVASSVIRPAAKALSEARSRPVTTVDHSFFTSGLSDTTAQRAGVASLTIPRSLAIEVNSEVLNAAVELVLAYGAPSAIEDTALDEAALWCAKGQKTRFGHAASKVLAQARSFDIAFEADYSYEVVAAACVMAAANEMTSNWVTAEPAMEMVKEMYAERSL